MISGVKMMGGMLVLRGIAAPNMPADQAETQTHPAIACLEAIFTAVRTWGDLMYLIEMCTLLRSHNILLNVLLESYRLS